LAPNRITPRRVGLVLSERLAAVVLVETKKRILVLRLHLTAVHRDARTPVARRHARRLKIRQGLPRRFDQRHPKLALPVVLTLRARRRRRMVMFVSDQDMIRGHAGGRGNAPAKLVVVAEHDHVGLDEQDFLRAVVQCQAAHVQLVIAVHAVGRSVAQIVAAHEQRLVRRDVGFGESRLDCAAPRRPPSAQCHDHRKNCCSHVSSIRRRGAGSNRHQSESEALTATSAIRCAFALPARPSLGTLWRGPFEPGTGPRPDLLQHRCAVCLFL
jgi:hypothetical protein